MKNTVYVIGVAALIALIYWAFSVKTPDTTEIMVEKPSVNSAAASTEKQLQTPEQPMEELQKVEGFRELSEQLQGVADMYEIQAQYPVYSRPISEPDSFLPMQSFEQTAVDIPFELNDGSQLTLSVATERFDYFVGDTFVGKVLIKDVPANADVSVRAEIKALKLDGSSKSAHTKQEMESLSSSEWVLESEVDKGWLEDPVTEQLLSVFVEVNGETLFSTSAFKVSEVSATLSSVKDENPNDEHLDIPVEFNVEQKGYYYLNAVLFDAKDDRPLVSLQAQGKLDSSNDSLVLRAHIAALKAANSEGPYYLSNIDIKRGAETGEIFDVPGRAENNLYPVQGFSFDRYVDKPFSDPLAVERTEFLRRLGSNSDGD